MLLYNTLTRREEEFSPSNDNTVRMYVCGLTVYARGHIGNFRTFVCIDILRRTLKYLAGFQLNQVVNFTDVDDKTIQASREAGVPLRDYTNRFIEAFREDSAVLGIQVVEEYPRATDVENLRAMNEQIEFLEERGHTYRSEGSIYFKIDTMSDYGKLSRLDQQGLKTADSIDNFQYEKKDARDFVLWKSTKKDEPTWDFGVGPGRPGWHIECSAMALRLLGEPPIDLHAGGVDLVFPHHENEIAQVKGATGKLFSRFWFHVEHLLINIGDKMSKSLGNVFSVRDVLDQGYRASALRYVLMSTHYRKQLNFNWESLSQADEAITRLMDCLARLETISNEGLNVSIKERLEQTKKDFSEMLLNDLNMPGALGIVFEFVRYVNGSIDMGEVGKNDAKEILDLFARFDKVLGIVELRRSEDQTLPFPVEELEKLIEERQRARSNRNFSRADQIRKDLDARGILLEDRDSGTRWKRK